MSPLRSSRPLLRLLLIFFIATIVMLKQPICHVDVAGYDAPPLSESNSLRKKIEKQNTTVVNNVSLPDLPVDESRRIEFIPDKNLTTFLDVFAASWWQTVDRFQKLNTSLIRTVEDDAFAPILHVAEGKKDVRMAVDWLDFSIEHLSKWWKIIREEGMTFGVGKLQSYIQHTMTSPKESNIMATTLAVIPYGVSSRNAITQKMWQTSLTATIASLVRHSVGRVVVVGHFEMDAKLALAAFRYLKRYDRSNTVEMQGEDSFSTTLGTTELAYVWVPKEEVKTEFIKINVPKGALTGLQQALRGEKSDCPNWLGTSPKDYKYVFLTESDQILQARLSPFFLQTMDEGRIIVPHRLQPVPHELDVEGVVPDSKLYLPASQFPHVHELGKTDSCCDTTDMPWKEGFPSGCGDFWWKCGFSSRQFGNHSRLASYDLMRLSDGTGIVTLASTEHSRHCIPRKGGC